jgi:hypothetical protein
MQNRLPEGAGCYNFFPWIRRKKRIDSADADDKNLCIGLETAASL